MLIRLDNDGAITEMETDPEEDALSYNRKLDDFFKDLDPFDLEEIALCEIVVRKRKDIDDESPEKEEG